MSHFGLPDEQWAALTEGLVKGEYALMLGAGASFGAHNGLGAPLPLAASLGSVLLTQYNIPAPPSTINLREVYDTADLIARRDTKELPSTFLARMFRNCTVPSWYQDLVSIPWQVIWTLNIDDVLENAYYNAFKSNAIQELRSVSWHDHGGYHREPGHNVTAVHLHGTADGGDIIFGSLEYLAAVTTGGPGHQLFWDEWAVTPTVVVGASLSDELDMAAPLSTIRPPMPGQPPSVVVLKSVSDYDRLRLETAGLVIVEATAEDFFTTIAADWANAAQRVKTDELMADSTISPTSAYFMRHFRHPSKREDRYHDFFAGDEPVYADILENRDARRYLGAMPDPCDPAFTSKLFPGGESTIVIMTGLLSGSTTCEFRLLRNLELAGMHVFEFDGEAAFDPVAVHWAFKRDPMLVVRIGDLADFPGPLSQLLDLARDAATTVRVVSSASAREAREITLAAGPAINVVEIEDRLRDREIDWLIEKLQEHNRLNRIKDLSPRERVGFFAQTHRRSLFDGLAAATQGRTFIARAENEYAAALADVHALVAQIVLISSELGYSLPEGLVARISGLQVGRLANLLENDAVMSRICYRASGQIAPRHRRLAARLSETLLKAEDRWSITLKLAKALRPYVDGEAISRRTRATRLAGQLMDADRIVGWFGHERADTWYQEVYDEFSWNSRYWEQRALAEIQAPKPRFEKSEAWAREAVSRHRDAYSLNTLGTVLLRKATTLSQFDLDLFVDGLREVENAEENLRRPSKHPYVTALYYLRRSLRRRGLSEHTRKKLNSELNEWVARAQNAEIWQDRLARRDLQRMIGLAMKVAVS